MHTRVSHRLPLTIRYMHWDTVRCALKHTEVAPKYIKETRGSIDPYLVNTGLNVICRSFENQIRSFGRISALSKIDCDFFLQRGGRNDVSSIIPGVPSRRMSETSRDGWPCTRKANHASEEKHGMGELLRRKYPGNPPHVRSFCANKVHCASSFLPEPLSTE